MAHRQILIPDTVFDLDDDETDLLLTELRLTARQDAPYDANAAANRLERANDPEPHRFTDPEAHALLRALDNLRSRGQLTSRGRMHRLRDALIGTLSTEPIPYELRFTDAVTQAGGWSSYSGPYAIGDRLSTPYGTWQVVHVETREDEPDLLTCAPVDGDS